MIFEYEFLMGRAVVPELLIHFGLCDFPVLYYFEVTIDVAVVVSLIPAAFLLLSSF